MDARAYVSNSGKMHDFLRIEAVALSNIVETMLPKRLEELLKGPSVPLKAFLGCSGKVARLRVDLTRVSEKLQCLSNVRFDSRRILLSHVFGKAMEDYYIPEIRALDESGNSYVMSISQNLDSHPLLPTFSV